MWDCGIKGGFLKVVYLVAGVTDRVGGWCDGVVAGGGVWGGRGREKKIVFWTTQTLKFTQPSQPQERKRKEIEERKQTPRPPNPPNSTTPKVKKWKRKSKNG